jgi:hypothetical protein
MLPGVDTGWGGSPMKTGYRVERRGPHSKYYDVWKGMLDPVGVFRPIDLRPVNRGPLDYDRANDLCRRSNEARRVVDKMGTYDKQLTAMEHITSCDRCGRFFRTAIHEVELQSFRTGPTVTKLDEVLLVELRRCPNWPKNV